MNPLQSKYRPVYTATIAFNKRSQGLGRSYTAGFRCDCNVNPEKVSQALISNNLATLREEVHCCKVVNGLRRDWTAYGMNSSNISPPVACKARKAISATLSYQLIFQKNIKFINELYLGVDHRSLSALIMKKNEITLAGEGGALVGEESYWSFLLGMQFPGLEKNLQIVSIGGAQGYDAVAIENVFKRRGYQTNNSIVADPNPFSAYLSQETGVDYYLTTGQEYFLNNFERNSQYSYIFHLGTVLSILPQEECTSILRIVAGKMAPNDTLSLITVHEKQMNQTTNRLERVDLCNEAGLVFYRFKENQAFYKTCIGNNEKFSRFMRTLGLEGKVVEIRNKEGFPVTFSVYRSMKEEEIN